VLPVPIRDENTLTGDHSGVIVLIAVNILAVAVWTNDIYYKWGFVPLNPTWYTALTSQFLHGDAVHLLGNMWALWLYGDNLSIKLGKWFVPFYLAGGAAANLMHWMSNRGSIIPCIGASGAVCAVMGGYFVLFPTARLKCIYYYGRGYRIISISAAAFGALYLMLQIIGTLRAPDGVAYDAHVGGLAFGIVIGLLLRLFRPQGDEAIAFSGGRGQAPDNDDSKDAVAAALKAGDEEVAVQRFANAIRADPYLELPENEQLMIADKLVFFGYPHLAKDALNRFLIRHSSSPNFPHASMLLGHLEESSFLDFDAAVQCFRQALAHAGSGEALKKDAEARLKHAETMLKQTFVDPPDNRQKYAIVRETSAVLTARQRKIVWAVTRSDGSSGILLKDASIADSSRMADGLEKSGVAVIVVPTNDLIPLPTAILQTNISSDVGGLTIGRPGGSSISIAWKDCLLIAVYGVAMAESLKKELGVLDAELESVGFVNFNFQSGLTHTPISITPQEYNLKGETLLCLEIISTNPDRRLRWIAQTHLENASEAKDRFYAAVRSLIVDAPNVPVNSGTQAALNGRLSQSCLFESLVEADRYIAWQLQLANYKKRRLRAATYP
jgi:membrane associated rhomboid family serine protease